MTTEPIKKNFILMGAAGYIAPRHIQAIKDVGGDLIAICDPSDSVGIIDRHFPTCKYFREFERLDRYCHKLLQEGMKIDYVSIATPNYLHDAHCRWALRMGADAICEKPLVLNERNLDALIEMEQQTGRKIYGMYQMRYHEGVDKIKKWLRRDRENTIVIDYCTPRGPWYDYSWKGDAEKAGGVESNIGCHLFDLCTHIFGAPRRSHIQRIDKRESRGVIEFDIARVEWHLSTKMGEARRVFTVNGQDIDFTAGFTDLHTKVYHHIILGEAYDIETYRYSIGLCENMREGAGPAKEGSTDCAPWDADAYAEGERKKPDVSALIPSIHKTAIIDEGAQIGSGTKIWHFCHVLPGSRIGKNCTIGQNCVIGPDVTIGDNCKIQNNVSVYKGVTLEDDVFVGPSAVFTNVNNPRAAISRIDEIRPTLVKKGATIGANATILCGVTIGKYAFVGAGAVVTKNVLGNALVVGNPAREVCPVDDRGNIQRDFGIPTPQK